MSASRPVLPYRRSQGAWLLHPAAGAMERLIRERETKVLVIVASPRALADQRSTFHTEVKTCIIAEINKDLTHHPVGEIEKRRVG